MSLFREDLWQSMTKVSPVHFSCFVAGGWFVRAKPNSPIFLWLSCEGHQSLTWDVYGDPHANHSRNLDRLALGGGRVFTHCLYRRGECCAPLPVPPSSRGCNQKTRSVPTTCDAMRKLPKMAQARFPDVPCAKSGYYCTKQTARTDYQFFGRPSLPRGHLGIAAGEDAPLEENRKTGSAPSLRCFNFHGMPREAGLPAAGKYRQVIVPSLKTGKQRPGFPGAFTNLPPYYPDTPVVRGRTGSGKL